MCLPGGGGSLATTAAAADVHEAKRETLPCHFLQEEGEGGFPPPQAGQSPLRRSHVRSGAKPVCREKRPMKYAARANVLLKRRARTKHSGGLKERLRADDFLKRAHAVLLFFQRRIHPLLLPFCCDPS